MMIKQTNGLSIFPMLAASDRLFMFSRQGCLDLVEGNTVGEVKGVRGRKGVGMTATTHVSL